MKTIEKIELGLYEIARECRTIDRVATSQETLNAIHEAYDRAQCMSFTGNVMELTQGRATVYWKQSFYEFLEQREQSGTRSGSAESRQKSSEAQFLDYRPLFGMTAYEFLHQWSHSVDKDWSMFK